MVDDNILEERTKKLIKYFKGSNILAIGLLVILVILGIYIRIQPMLDHDKNTPGIQPGLWDYTTNDWTLGPDLDPWLFTRYAKIIIEKGDLPRIDYMRYPPLGYNTYSETRFLPYMMAWVYYILNSFFGIDPMFAAALFPVIMFSFTIIIFFFFVREIFIEKLKDNRNLANIIAIVSTLFMIVIPTFLSRTVAGIPEKESAGFFFLFLALYLFLVSWGSKGLKKVLLFSILAGVSTGVIGLIWGGVVYVFVTISLASILAFIFNKIEKREIMIYLSWLISAIITIMIFSERYTFIGLLTSTRFLISSVTLFIFITYYIINYTPISKLEIFKKIKLPRNIISLILSIILGIVLIIILFGPNFILGRINEFIQTFINPTTGRWGVTVAENRQPYFTEWQNDFGPIIKNIPLMFWMFFIGSVLLFRDMFKELKKSRSLVLMSLYVLFFFGLVFSRYAPHPHILDGEGSLSRLFYFGSAILFTIVLFYYYILDNKENKNVFKNINFNYILLFSLFILCLFTARSAIRLIMVLAPIATIFVGYANIELFDNYKKSKDELYKIILAISFIIFLIFSIFTFFTFYNTIKAQAYSFIPSYYNYQWQNAMDWVRKNTSETAVFSHWWDYGYWLQSIGQRTTVLDGGNSYAYWNYLMGRYVLTGDNQKDALDYLYAHNATHLLIDSSDIGKYGAFSSIGSDKDFDRYSWIGSFLLDEKQTYETNNQTFFIYSGGIASDEDIITNESGKEVLLPGKSSAVVFIMIPNKIENNTRIFDQPSVIMYYKNIQHKLKIRYLYVDGKFTDFKTGIPACAYVLPLIKREENNRIGQNTIGAAMYLSPRLMRGYLAQKYILNDPFNKFPNFILTHTEPNLIIESLNNQGMNLPDFVYFDGIQGPIKIWTINYTGKETIREEFIGTDPNKYGVTWSL